MAKQTQILQSFLVDFAFDDVVNQNDLDDKTRMIAILATLIGCQAEKL